MHRYLLIVCAVILFFSAIPVSAATKGELIKASQPTVYFSYGGKRYTFPNEQVYFSWYKDFSNIKTISDAELAAQPLSGNVQFQQGGLVKITTDPKVYVVTGGNQLRWLPSEAYAKAAFGADWAKKIKDVSDADFQNYLITDPISNGKPPEYYFATISDLFDAIQLSQARIEQTPTGDRSMIPSTKVSLVQETKYGFAATTTMTLDETKAWFVSKMGETKGYQEMKTFTTGTLSMTVLMVNDISSVQQTFRHRSWSFISKDGGNIISYADIIFPQGLIAYPRVANDPQMIHTDIDNVTKYAADSLDAADTIIQWYMTNGAKYGWTVEKDLELSEVAMGYTVLRLRNQTSNMELQVGISETGISSHLDVLAKPLEKSVSSNTTIPAASK